MNPQRNFNLASIDTDMNSQRNFNLTSLETDMDSQKLQPSQHRHRHGFSEKLQPQTGSRPTWTPGESVEPRSSSNINGNMKRFKFF
jgi:hypothetical protein